MPPIIPFRVMFPQRGLLHYKPGSRLSHHRFPQKTASPSVENSFQASQTDELRLTRWLRSKPATPSRLPQPTQPRFGRHKTLFFARCGSPAVSHLLEKLFIGVEPDERVEQALLRFAQTADREFVVENGEGRLIGTL